MSLIGLTGIFKVRFIHDWSNQVAYNVTHWQMESGDTGIITTQEAADAISTVFGPLFRARLAAGARYYGCDVQDITQIDVEDPSPSLLQRGQGAIVGELLPPGVSSVLALRTGLARRYAQGRIYPPFPSEVDNDADGYPTAGQVAATQAIGNALVAGVTVTSGPNSLRLVCGVYSRKLNRFFELLGTVARAGWGYQRRRGFFGATNDLPW